MILNSLDVPRSPESTRVVVAMSGGVDSSVVAALLKRQRYDVVGVTLQLYDHAEATRRKGACCAGQDVYDARRVAEMLAIPHYVLDYEQRFREAVIDGFAESYIHGETPVPCVSCNQSIKFHDLLETARDLGADVLATGHYVSSRRGPAGRQLYQAFDADRDQSYFLFATTREQLEHLRFPLGDMAKAEVRDLAREIGLPVAAKPDSQDICFVPTGRYSEVIERLRPEAAKPGEIVHLDGRVLGRHDGIINFTVGQRRGIGIALGEPLYVVGIDAGRARVVVGPREALLARMILLRDFNWIGDPRDEPAVGDEVPVFARVRSTRPQQAALLRRTGQGMRIELADGDYGISPGQACVLYDSAGGRARVLGGGFIAEARTGLEAAAAGPAFSRARAATVGADG